MSSQFLIYNKEKLCKLAEYQPDNLDKGKVWVDFYLASNPDQVYESGVVEKSLLQPFKIENSNSLENTDLQPNCNPIVSHLQPICEANAPQMQPNYNRPIAPNVTKTLEEITLENKDIIQKLIDDSFIKKYTNYPSLELSPINPPQSLAVQFGLSPEALRPIGVAARVEKVKQTYEKKYIKKQYHIFYCFVCVLISFGLGLILFGFDLINFDNEEIFVNQQTNLVEDKNFVLSLEKTIKYINQKPYTRFDQFVDSLAAKTPQKWCGDYRKNLIKDDFKKSLNKTPQELINIVKNRLNELK